MNDSRDGLRLSDALSLPVNGAIARYVIIAKSGAGKTNSDCVLIEEFVRTSVPTIVFDPLGNMYGLRSSADGEGAGLPMAIFGGAHGDVPLPIEKAFYIADLLAEGVSAVLDLSAMDLEESVEFAKLLIPRYQQRLQGNAHVVFEEADRFTPNAVGHKNPINTFARTARNGGIGWTFSTQRPQILSKAVIDSASVFIAMRMTGSLAQEAIGGEIGSRIGKKLAASMIADLPHFARGEAWFIPEPDFLGDDEPEMEPKRFRFRLRETFDVRPPKVGEIRREPKVLADVDLEHLRAALAIEEPAEDDDVDALKARIAELTEQIETISKVSPSSPEIVEVDVFHDGELAELEELIERFEVQAQAMREAYDAGVKTLVDLIGRRDAALARIATPLGDRTESAAADPGPRSVRVATSGPESTGRRRAEGPIEPGALIRVGNLSGGRQRMLDVLAANRDGRLTRAELGMLSGYAHGGGTFQKYASELKGQGLIEVLRGQIVLTDAGRALATPVKRTSREVTGHWLGVVKGGRRAMLEQLVKIYPAAISRAELGERAGYASDGGTYQKYLSDLKGADLVTVTSAGVRAADELFPTGAIR